MTLASKSGSAALGGRRGRRFGALLACTLCLSAQQASAQQASAQQASAQQASAQQAPPRQDAETRTAARDLATQGAQAFDAGQFSEASDFFRRAHELVPAPSIALLEARSLAKVGELLEAVDIYEQTARLKLPSGAPEAYESAVQTAHSEVEEVRARVPRLKLSVLGVTASDMTQVSIDGKPTPSALLGVERPVNPGVHHFVVRVGGQMRAARELAVVEGQSYQVELDAQASHPAAEPSGPVEAQPEPHWAARRTLAYLGLGVGAVGLGLGTYTGLVALHHKSNLDSVCQATCPQASAGDIEGWRSNRAASWISYGVGLAAGASGVLLLTLGKPNHEHVALRAVPNGVQVGGLL